LPRSIAVRNGPPSAPGILLRGGRTKEAMEKENELKGPADSAFHIFFLVCVDPRACAEWKRAAQKIENDSEVDADQENHYFFGAYLAFYGEHEGGVRLLKSAVAKGYCATSALQAEPIFSKAAGDAQVHSIGFSFQELPESVWCANRIRLSLTQVGYGTFA